jgi:phospho-N-acetylmuramoyl-pentapeptide-transferase
MTFTPDTAVTAALFAFAASVALCPLAIPYLAKLKFGQYVRGDGPSTHISKAGTPTMGGLMIVAGFLLPALFYVKDNKETAALVMLVLCCGAIGFADDFIKIRKKRSLGLRAYQKLLLELAAGGGFLAYCYTLPGFSPVLAVPFFPQITLDIGVFYIPFCLFVILGTVNGANFTDGLDGLGAGVTAVLTVFFIAVAAAGGGGVLPAAGAMLGSLLGFLLFNAYPARVFMGDTGSLALGGFVAGAAILLGLPLFLGIAACVYVAEVLSVIIQVCYFKATRGRRFFKMAPIHHSFELSGWPETRVTAFFTITTVVTCMIGYIAYGT